MAQNWFQISGILLVDLLVRSFGPFFGTSFWAIFWNEFWTNFWTKTPDLLYFDYGRNIRGEEKFWGDGKKHTPQHLDQDPLWGKNALVDSLWH